MRWKCSEEKPVNNPFSALGRYVTGLFLTSPAQMYEGECLGLCDCSEEQIVVVCAGLHRPGGAGHEWETCVIIGLC